MNNLFFMSVVAIASTALITQCEAQPNDPKPNELVTVKGFQLSVMSDSEKVAWNTPVNINTAIKNVTDKSLVLGINSNGNGYKIEVKNKAGETMPFTRYGEALEKGKKTSFGNGPLDISPSESYLKSFPVSQIFDMTLPDDYFIKFSYPILDTEKNIIVEATSNVLHVEVTRQ